MVHQISEFMWAEEHSKMTIGHMNERDGFCHTLEQIVNKLDISPRPGWL